MLVLGALAVATAFQAAPLSVAYPVVLLGCFDLKDKGKRQDQRLMRQSRLFRHTTLLPWCHW